MTEPAGPPPPSSPERPSCKTDTCPPSSTPAIPVELITDEEMFLIESAFVAAASRYSIRSSSISKRSLLSTCSTAASSSGSLLDIEDITIIKPRASSNNNNNNNDDDDDDEKTPSSSLLPMFWRNRALAVTDLTSSEWCEKKMEFSLLRGKPEPTKAMKAGTTRHIELEEEVLERVIVYPKTSEDVWALKFMNFVTGVNQLLFDRLTRELPVLGFVEGVWMIGVIDELRMPVIETEKNPTLVDTKTRLQATLPSEAQRRNGRLQLMYYKKLWDNLVGGNFPFNQFFDFFSLDPHCILSQEIRERTAYFGKEMQTLDDLVECFRNTCCLLPRAHGQLLLRYELQEDRSLLDEDLFQYDENWMKGKLQYSLEFLQGKREAEYTPEQERWKCYHCKFADECPVKFNPTDKSI